MIVIRRFLAILLIPIFLVWFTASTVRSGLDRTLFDDSFLADQLEEQDFYNWLHDDLIRVALDDMANVGMDVDSAYLPEGNTTVSFADPATTRDAARALLRATFPPEYLQETTALALAGFMPYVRGESDEFAIPLALNERVSGFFSGVGDTYVEIDLANVLVEDLLAPAAIQSATDFTEGPFGLVLTPEQAGGAAPKIVPPEWIDKQVFTTLDALNLYLSGQSDTLAINISFKDRVPIAAQVTKDLLTESNAETVIFDKLIKPQITEKIGQVTVLSYQVTIGDDEITDAVNDITPPEWDRGHIDAIVDNVALYMSKESDSLAYTVDLSDQRDAAIEIVTELAVAKARAEVEALPQCGSLAEAQNAARAIQSGSLPICTDPNIPIDQFLEQLESRLTTEVQQTIGASFPDSVTYDEATFTSALEGQGSTDLEGVRDKIADGITIDSGDVLEQLSDQDQTAQRMLEIIRTGRPYTVDDFERYREERALALGTDDLENVDLFRGGLGLVLGPLGASIAIGISLLILFVIGILGGRAWTSRLIWAASGLTLSALIIWLAFAQVLSGYGAEFAEDALLEEIEDRIAVEQAEGDPTGMLELARDEGVAKASAVGDAVTSEFASYALLWLAAGVIAILVGIAIRVTRGNSTPRYSSTGYRYRGAQPDQPVSDNRAIDDRLAGLREDS
ncbi:MAG: hypothetical protein QF554_05265 [Dehalococcoidia bacterium]|nr:hypothetical protein [Dehalococcoidia bacterium]